MKCHTNIYDPERKHIYGRDEFCILCGHKKKEEKPIVNPVKRFYYVDLYIDGGPHWYELSEINKRMIRDSYAYQMWTMSITFGNLSSQLKDHLNDSLRYVTQSIKDLRTQEGAYMSKGWNHGYLGIVLFIVGVPLTFAVSYWFLFMSVPGLILMVDEYFQWRSKNQYGGFVHNIYIATLYKLAWVRKFGVWMDGLFGKKVKDDKN